MEYFQTNSADSTYQGISFKIIGKLLTNDPTVKTVANIGCGFAYYDGLLAEKHQNRKFYGFDFNDDLEEENEINAKRGVKFISGYPLANIMESERRFDIVYFTSCASTIRNIELHKYLEILSKKTKYVLFSEPIYPDPCGNSIDPDSVNVHDSIPVFCQRDTYDNIFGYLCFVHNYREIAEFYGYKTIEYSVKKYKCGPYWWITYLAKKE
ncbi:MAG: hypothetical protein VW124_21250 [Paracoccaceae bacterium]